MTGKRRRSPRISKQKEVQTNPPKRQKLERKGTVELEGDIETPSKLDRKTTSFLQSIPKLTSMSSSISSKNNSKLLKRLSSIMNPNVVEPKSVNLIQREGILETLPWPLDYSEEQKANSLENIPLDIILSIFNYLPSNSDKRNLGMTCKRMMSHLCNFVAPCDKTQMFRWKFTPLNESICRELMRPDLLEPPTKSEDWIFTADWRYSISCAIQAMMWTDYKWEGAYTRQIRAACQPDGLTLPLYDYQAKALSWMLSIERIARRRQPISYSTIVYLPGQDVACNYDYTECQFLVPTKEHLQDEEYQKSFTTQGGIFADEMGLGKTISIISLILSNPRQKRSDDTFAPSLVTAEALFESQATLVICPSNLTAQWEQEITKNTNLVCHTITTAPNHKKVRYKTLVESDVVVVSYEFLTSNSTYIQLMDQRKKIMKARKTAPQATTRRSRAAAKNSTTNKEPEISYIQPLFHLIGWHRIVIDEAHELLYQGGINFSKFQSNYRWYVTGTPLPNEFISLNVAMDFINVKSTSEEGSSRTIFSQELTHRAVHRSLFWRNTKTSVNKQIEIPPIVEETILVNLSPVERAIYDSLCYTGKDDYRAESHRRQFLFNPNIRMEYRTPVVPLDDPNLPKRYFDLYTQRCQEAVDRLRGSQARLLRIQQKGLPLSENEECDKRYAIESIERYESEILAAICKCACFSRLLDGESTTDICDVCDEYAAGRTGLSCKHNVCTKCLQEIFLSEKRVCSKCNTGVDISLLSASKLPEDKEIPQPEGENDEWVDRLRIEHGSKFAATAKYLRDVMDGDDDSVKMIVFSQYDALLWELAAILENENAKLFQNRIVRYKGNVHVRKKLLAKFTDTSPDSPRILFISLSNAAGAHLAVATHVLLLDPVVGTVGEAKSTDAQAIARAHRLGQGQTVIAVRFIVQNSIDQEDYENAYGEIVCHRGLGPKSARK